MPRRRETAREKQLRKEMELLGMTAWMVGEADLITAAVSRTGESMRQMLRVLAGKETDDAQPDRHPASE